MNGGLKGGCEPRSPIRAISGCPKNFGLSPGNNADPVGFTGLRRSCLTGRRKGSWGDTVISRHAVLYIGVPEAVRLADRLRARGEALRTGDETLSADE